MPPFLFPFRNKLLQGFILVFFRYITMEDFDMDADDVVEQENEKSPKKKSNQPSGIALEALTGLLDSYSSGDAKVRNLFKILNAEMLPSIQSSRRPVAAAPFQQQQQSHSSSVKPAATISTPARSAPIAQISTPSVATFQARVNKAEVVAEHVGNHAKDRTTAETRKTPSIQFKSMVKPYKYMYQTIYKRAAG